MNVKPREPMGKEPSAGCADSDVPVIADISSNSPGLHPLVGLTPDKAAGLDVVVQQLAEPLLSHECVLSKLS